jgi:hypothetical protein
MRWPKLLLAQKVCCLSLNNEINQHKRSKVKERWLKEIKIISHAHQTLIRDNRSMARTTCLKRWERNLLSVFAYLTIQQIPSPRRGYQ